jgi:carboxyl-terminal processing protease
MIRGRGYLAGAVVAVAAVAGGWMMRHGLASRPAPAPVDQQRLFESVLSLVARSYVDSGIASQLYRKAVDGMLGELGDPNAAFVPPGRLTQLSGRGNASQSGLGIDVDVRGGFVTVLAPLPGSPADDAGIHTGDRVSEIDGRSTLGWTADDAARALRGEPGTRVTLTLRRPGIAAPLHFVLTRRTLRWNAARHALMLESGLGYIALSEFNDSTAVHVRMAVDSLRHHGATSLIVDMRNSSAGALEHGAAVADLFLNARQRIVSVRGRYPEVNQEVVDSTPELWPDLALVVLLDGESSGAAELVAGALQDHDRALLIGTRSLGQGNGQSSFGLSGGGALKLTTAFWYTPSGRRITRRAADVAAAVRDSAGEGTRSATRTDGGRTVIGGGGIAPDIEVRPAAAAASDLALYRALGSEVSSFYDVLNDIAAAAKSARAVASPDFVVTPGMLEEVWTRMQQRSVRISRSSFDASSALVARLLGYRVAYTVFGPAAGLARMAVDDPVIQTASEMARGVRTPAELFTRATERARSGSRKGGA